MMYDDTVNYRATTPVTKKLLNGTASYTIIDACLNGDSLIKVTVEVVFNGVTRQAIAYSGVLGGWVPPFVRGAWTANGNLNKTISDMYIDGRDHLVTANLISDSLDLKFDNGVAGVSTSVPFINVQKGAIGGTFNSTDYPMTYPENPKVIDLYNWGGQFPENPDEILGYPIGTLKSIAMSKKEGSQYVTDIKKLHYPLSGVTFIEPKNASEFEIVLSTPPAGQVNKGMLIIHRKGRTSALKGLKALNKTDPPFVGIIITDYSFHHHLNVLGAMMQLSPDLEMDKECIGNKDHWVFYSSQAIINATEIAAAYSGTRGNNNSKNYNNSVSGALGGRRYAAIAYYE